MVRRLMKGGHTCVVYDRDPANNVKLVAERARRGRHRSTNSSPS